ncbi:MAG: hypothetical protein IPN62_11705 [Flavobacteriales bacterium]|nr:hypothetical protein [Flavobacteriales bacterium]
MNLENEFDELARRKLKEQEHPFEESHWHEAQRMIVAQRKGRGGRMIIGTLALLFLGTAAWWATRPHDASSLTSAAEQAAPKAIPHPTSSGSSSTAVSSTVNATRSNTLEDTGEGERGEHLITPHGQGDDHRGEGPHIRICASAAGWFRNPCTWNRSSRLNHDKRCFHHTKRQQRSASGDAINTTASGTMGRQDAAVRQMAP